MKKIYNLAIATGLALALAGCGDSVSTPSGSDIAKLDVKTVCNVKANGIENVLATAKKYNKIAVQKHVEFMRFKISNTKAIAEIEKTLKEGKTTVALMKKKKYSLTSVDDAANRACKFAIGALRLNHDSQTQWHDSVPGDGFKY